MEPRLLLFDFDGTIAESFSQHMAIINRLTLKYGVTIFESSFSKLVYEKNLMELIKLFRISPLVVPLIVFNQRRELYKVIDSIQPVQGIPEVLREIRKRYKKIRLGLLTSNSKRNVNRFIANHDLDIFDIVYSSCSIYDKSRSMNRLLKRERLPSSKVIYFGDEVRDILSAKRVNIACGTVTWGFNSEKLLLSADPEFVLRKPDEIFDLLPENKHNLQWSTIKAIDACFSSNR
ncbi:HAD-IA family hydrolase [candidate division KSB1 bacterium]|nr:HAD-IA family hydrolase [candidate division KSB1 bacterium]